MSIHQLRLSTIALTLASISLSPRPSLTSEIALPGDHAYPESITAAPDGTLYVSSPAVGGVWRIKPQTGTVEEWIKPGAFGTRSTLGVLVDSKANLLWVCSNDFSSAGIPGPSSVPGSFVKGFDLASGEGKVSAELPGRRLCNDMVVGPDGSLFVTNSLAPQILKLKPGSNQLEVWLEIGVRAAAARRPRSRRHRLRRRRQSLRQHLRQWKFLPRRGEGRTPGKITKLKPSRAVQFPDGLRSTGGQTFVMAEGGGSVDSVTVSDDGADIETIKDGIAGPTSVVPVGQTLWVSEGQLPHLFEAAKSGPPHFRSDNRRSHGQRCQSGPRRRQIRSLMAMTNSAKRMGEGWLGPRLLWLAWAALFQHSAKSRSAPRPIPD